MCFLGLQTGLQTGLQMGFLGGVLHFLTFLGGVLEQDELLWETDLSEQELLSDLDLDLLLHESLTLWEEQLANLFLPSFLCPDLLRARAPAKTPDLGFLKLLEQDRTSEQDNFLLWDDLELHDDFLLWEDLELQCFLLWEDLELQDNFLQ